MNWIEFLNEHFIPFVTGGKNTSKGWISINCPFCEGSDSSEHLGIHLKSGRFHCWRDRTHGGTKPEYLISRLLGCTKGQATLIIKGYTGATGDDFGSLQSVTGAWQGDLSQGASEPLRPVPWPSEFESLTPIFLAYLKDRGFDKPDKVAAYYNLECCQVGRWKQRLIIPVLDKDRNILGWQGRAIVTPKKAPRYLTSHPQVKRACFNLQNLNEGGGVLFICEGPLDVLKLDYFGKPKYRATGTFGVNISLDQINQLNKLIPKFKKTCILLDPDSAGVSGGFELSEWLPGVMFGQTLPGGDPGSMTKQQIGDYLNEYQ